jgi:hypothetical protein
VRYFFYFLFLFVFLSINLPAKGSPDEFVFPLSVVVKDGEETVIRDGDIYNRFCLTAITANKQRLDLHTLDLSYGWGPDQIKEQTKYYGGQWWYENQYGFIRSELFKKGFKMKILNEYPDPYVRGQSLYLVAYQFKRKMIKAFLFGPSHNVNWKDIPYNQDYDYWVKSSRYLEYHRKGTTEGEVPFSYSFWQYYQVITLNNDTTIWIELDTCEQRKSPNWEDKEDLLIGTQLYLHSTTKHELTFIDPSTGKLYSSAGATFPPEAQAYYWENYYGLGIVGEGLTFPEYPEN